MFADTDTGKNFVALLLLKNATLRSTVVETTGCLSGQPSTALAALGDEAIRWVSQHNRPLVLDNGVGILSRMQGILDKAGLHSAAILPLTSLECPIGAVVFGCRTGLAPFATMDVPSLTLLGHLLSNALEQLHLFERKRAIEAIESTGQTRETTLRIHTR